MSKTERKLPRPFSMPWGRGQITEEVQLVRDHWEPTIQLMEYEDGARGLRFCFYSRGRFNRNPMMLGESDLDDLAQALNAAPTIRAMLQRMAGAGKSARRQLRRRTQVST